MQIYNNFLQLFCLISCYIIRFLFEIEKNSNVCSFVVSASLYDFHIVYFIFNYMWINYFVATIFVQLCNKLTTYMCTYICRYILVARLQQQIVFIKIFNFHLCINLPKSKKIRLINVRHLQKSVKSNKQQFSTIYLVYVNFLFKKAGEDESLKIRSLLQFFSVVRNSTLLIKICTTQLKYFCQIQ